MTKNFLPLATLLLAGLSPIALAAPATAQTASATAEAAGADARLRALYDACPAIEPVLLASFLPVEFSRSVSLAPEGHPPGGARRALACT